MSDSSDAVRNRFDTSRSTAPLVFQPEKGLKVHGLELVRALGAGAMGEVWLAIDPTRAGDDQAGYVAAKFLPPELQRVQREWRRVERVFRDVQGLQHPGICPVYQLHTNGLHGPCLVMKYVEGQTLMEWRDSHLDRHGDFPLAVAVLVLRKIAEALDYAHDPETRAGHTVPRVIHRDIKPENILVTADGKGVQIVDFGIASRLRQTLVSISNRPLDSSGTRPYMAPEQWRCEEADARTDQYALGVVAFEMLTDRLPFEVHDQFALERAVLERPVPPVKGFPPHVHEAIARAMAKRPEERFRTCVEFVDALAGSFARQGDVAPAVAVDQRPPLDIALADTARDEGSDNISASQRPPAMDEDADDEANAGAGTPPQIRNPETDPGPDLAVCHAAWQAAVDSVVDASCDFGDIEVELLLEQQRRVGLLETFVPASQTVRDQDRKIAEVTKRLERQQGIVVARLADRDKADAAVCAALETQISILEAEVRRLTDSGGIGYRPDAPAVRQVQSQIDQLRSQQEPHRPGLQRHRGETERVRVREFLEQPANLIRQRTTSLGIEIRKLPAGSFQMGSNAAEDEEPVHSVRISRPFWLAKYPVTVGQTLKWLNTSPQINDGWIDWTEGNCPVKRDGERIVLNSASPFGQSEDQPMVLISWHGAKAFCDWASQQESGCRYSLPTEAQWEYACRAGTSTTWFFGDDAGLLGEFAWFYGNAKGVTHAVGEKRPNPWGLHDMLGNVWEWCADWYEITWYAQSPEADPPGPPAGSSRVVRGGSFGHEPRYVRCALRLNYVPTNRLYNVGFRIVVES